MKFVILFIGGVECGKSSLHFFSILLVGLFAFSVYSQEETPTVEVTDEPTAEVTPDETAELTPTVEDTPGETSAPSPTATPEATEEICPGNNCYSP